jgi:hypothetical protein
MPKTNSVESRIRDMIGNQRDAVVRSRPMTMDRHAGDGDPMVLDMDPSQVPPSKLNTPAGRESVLGFLTSGSSSLLPRPPVAGDDHNPLDAGYGADPYLNDSWKDVRQANASQDKFIGTQMRTNSMWKNYGEPQSPGGRPVGLGG